MEDTKYLTLKEWDEDDKPRERFISKGKKELSNAELIGIIIGNGSQNVDAVKLARQVLDKVDNNLVTLSKMSHLELQKDNKGIGTAKAVSILAALELGYRMLRDEKQGEAHYLRCSEDIFEFISPKLVELPHEEFWAIYLNIRNKVIFQQRISVGGISQTAVDLRIILRKALELNAVSIAVCHNHPGGSTEPSKADIKLTNNLLAGALTLNISIIDHIIVALNDNDKPDYYSFRDNGLL